MKTRTVSTLLATLLLLTSVLLQTAFAAQPSQPMHLQEKHSPSTEFHSYLLQTLPKDLASVASVSFHYPLNAGLVSLEKEASIQSALAQAGRFSLFDPAKDASHLQPVKTANVDEVLRKQTPTLVIFPGIFAEFIRVRAFEEVFAAPSVAQKQFQASLQAAQAKPQLAQLLRDPSFNSASMKAEDVPLSQLIEVASIDDAKGNALTRVVLMKSPFLSLESVGDQSLQAQIITRRLEKYLALTGAQKLVFVGYSRGLNTALETLAVGAREKKAWVKDVHAVVSYGGVVFGSSIADDLNSATTPLTQLVELLKKLRADLKVPESATDLATVAANTAAWVKFAADAAALAPKAAPSEEFPEADQVLDGSSSLDLGSPLSLITRLAKEMGLEKPISNYSENVARFQLLIDANVIGLSQLRTENCLNWWKTHTLPTHVKYYSLAAAMADPTRSGFEKSLFLSPYSYGRGYDDKILLDGHRDYLKLSGVTLNDSQTSVAQSMFLPGVIKSLNPQQAPLDIRNLGVVNSHHWGLALRVVNEMKDGRVNPFPRTAILKALAAKVAADSK